MTLILLLTHELHDGRTTSLPSHCCPLFALSQRCGRHVVVDVEYDNNDDDNDNYNDVVLNDKNYNSYDENDDDDDAAATK